MLPILWAAPVPDLRNWKERPWLTWCAPYTLACIVTPQEFVAEVNAYLLVVREGYPNNPNFRCRLAPQYAVIENAARSFKNQIHAYVPTPTLRRYCSQRNLRVEITVVVSGTLATFEKLLPKRPLTHRPASSWILEQRDPHCHWSRAWGSSSWVAQPPFSMDSSFNFVWRAEEEKIYLRNRSLLSETLEVERRMDINLG